MRTVLWLTVILSFVCSCSSLPKPDPMDPVVARGRDLFFKETFNGNGRTCGTCHPTENNLTLDPAFIASLPNTDPLFVAEFIPALSENFENPTLMRALGLILENQDGFDDLANDFNMRGIPHTLGMRTSIESQDGPRTGWSGDGSPGDGSLRSFATGAVIQHFTLTTDRIAGVDFRLPTDDELDAMEAFQQALGRQEDPVLPLTLKSPVVARGQELFNDINTGKCFGCHFNAGANASPSVFGEGAGNLNFDTGVEALPDQPADLLGELNPPDDGFGSPGSGEFNTPSLVEAAETGPFFHNNAVETLEAAVAFYNGDSFRNSAAGQLLLNATGSSINLDATQAVAVAAFLRVVNALDNIELSIGFIENYLNEEFLGHIEYAKLFDQAIFEITDAYEVLERGGLHPEAVQFLKQAELFLSDGLESKRFKTRTERGNEAIAFLNRAKIELIDP